MSAPPPVAIPSVEIYTDGGCEPNPGLGGYGVVLVHPKKRAEASGGFRLTTNNRKTMFNAGHQAERKMETDAGLLFRVSPLLPELPDDLPR